MNYIGRMLVVLEKKNDGVEQAFARNKTYKDFETALKFGILDRFQNKDTLIDKHFSRWIVRLPTYNRTFVIADVTRSVNDALAIV